jgi:hypothetical protein
MLNQITTMRLPDGSEVAFVDWQDKPLFSTVDLLSGFNDSDIDAFTYVPGDTVPSTQNGIAPRTASERDTNVSTPGSMASTEELLVYAIKPYYHELRTADGTPTEFTSAAFAQGGQPIPATGRLATLHFWLVLRLIVSQKAEQEAPLGYFNTGFGVFSGAMQDRVAATSLDNRGSAGIPTQEAVRSYVIPTHIGGQEKYRVTLANDAGPAGGVDFGVSEATPPVVDDQIVMQVGILLDGLYKRPVT